MSAGLVSVRTRTNFIVVPLDEVENTHFPETKSNLTHKDVV